MRRYIIVVLMCAASVLAFAQTSSSQWQTGTITAVSTHVNGPGEPAGNGAQYDVTVKVGNTVYVVLYSSPSGSNTVEYRRGFDLLVRVGADTLTFNKGGVSVTTEVPILHKAVLPESAPDLSRVSSQYFTLKLQNLSVALDLSSEQQKQIKPIIEQETAEVAQFWDNPVLTRKDKLNRWEKTVRSSDKKLKQYLSTDQVQKLQEMRQEQKKQVQQLSAEQK